MKLGCAVCPSIDIRNGPNQLSELEGCRVIEGFLHIVLIDSNNGDKLNNYTFPMLREITGYLLVYRVAGLLSIGDMFPNLAVIRGQQLLFDFSLVIYEAMQLQVCPFANLSNVLADSTLKPRRS